MGHIVHSGASEPQNIDTLFFMLRWAWCCFHKKRIVILYAELVFFASSGIYGLGSAFWYVRGANH
jgi:hypothetical protein